MAYPDRVFKGRVSKIYATVDPNTHRVTIRSEIADPNDELRPGMLANFVIRVHDPVEAIAIPANGVVREADGTMTAWVTTDRRHFVQRIIKIGLRKRRPGSDSRRFAARRTGRDRRRRISEQHAAGAPSD